MRGQLATEDARRIFVFGGRATFTLESIKTGTRFTYKVFAPKDGGRVDFDSSVRFVKVLTGPDNDADYSYVGFIRDGEFRHGGDKAKVSEDATSVRAFAWFIANLGSEDVAVWHEGSCARCGRTLTVPESIETGLGPICMSRA